MSRQGLSPVEGLLGLVLLVAVSLPWLEVWGTRPQGALPKVPELQATNLANELREQLSAWPEAQVAQLSQGLAKPPNEGWTAKAPEDLAGLELSPLPPGFSRRLGLRLHPQGLLFRIQVEWPEGESSQTIELLGSVPRAPGGSP